VVVGTQGSLTVDFGQSVVTLFRNLHERRDGRWTAVAGKPETFNAAGEEPLRQELASFMYSVSTSRAPSPGVAEGLLALQVVEAAHLSSRVGRRVALEEAPVL